VVNDGLPETLEEVVARYGQRWFKLKSAATPGADVERLMAIAAVLDRIPQRLPCVRSMATSRYDDLARCGRALVEDEGGAAA
jgi:hypothetical protein